MKALLPENVRNSRTQNMNEVTMKQELITAFCEENMKTIYTYALSRVSRREDAENLTGEIILALLSSASRLRDEEALYGYIWSIAGKEPGSGRDRYQTNLVIFTEEYREELYEKLTPLCLTGLTGILQTLMDQLPWQICMKKCLRWPPDCCRLMLPGAWPSRSPMLSARLCSLIP